MPRLSGWFVRASLVYLALGFSLGAVLLVNKAWEFNPLVLKFLPVHSEVLLVGWLIQLAMGVAYWILPRVGGSAPRGNPWLIGLSFGSLTIGVILVIAGSVTPLSRLILLGRLLELVGVAAFVISSWKRIKPFAG